MTNVDWPAISIEQAEARLTAPGAEFEMETLDTVYGPMRGYRNAPSSLRATFDGSWQWRQRCFLVFEDERYSYEAHNRAVVALARILVERYGVCKGDRIAFAMRNWPEWSIVFWASVSIGAIAVPLNAWWSAAELEVGIQGCEPTVLIVDAERLERLGRPSPETYGVRGVVVVRGPSDSSGIDALDDLIGSPEHYGALSEETLPEVDIGPDDPATILFTSGTSGAPKGALATHRNVTCSVLSRRFPAAFSALRRGQSPPSSGAEPVAILSPVPLFHVTGSQIHMVPTLASGNTIVFMYRWVPERALELIARERVVAMSGVPTMLVQMLDSPALGHHDLSCLQNLGCGGAPSGAALAERVRTALPHVHTGNGYGMTETATVTMQNIAEDHRKRPDSVGRALPICDVRVVDADGNDVAIGVEGEMWVRGANVITQYWNNPGATAEAFVDGWLRTGDVVRMDEEGFVFVVDRIKDIVIRGGENVYCSEVEDALLVHPDVMESAVFGVPDDEYGEIVAAVVECDRDTAMTADELRATAAARLAAFKVPEVVEIRTEPLPANAAGKVLKRELRAEMIARRRADGLGY